MTTDPVPTENVAATKPGGGPAKSDGAAHPYEAAADGAETAADACS